MSRLTRREMKRDEVREGLTHLIDYVREHGRQLVIGVALVAVLALVIGGWLAYTGHRQELANGELARAIKLYEAPVDAVAPQPEDPTSPSFAEEAARNAAAQAAFERVRSIFGGSRVAAVAAAYLADLASRSGDLARARELWDEAAAAKQSVLTAEVLLNRIAADRTEGRGEEALEELRAMLEGGDPPLPQVVILDQMATILISLERRDEARDIYQRIADEFPQTAYSARARQQVQSL